MKISDKLKIRLEKRKESQVFRATKLFDSNKKDFFSNDYLGYAKIHKKSISNGSSGSRLISGTHQEHLNLEKFIADFHKSEAALIFNSGYDANLGFFSCVPQKSDVVLYDELIHASIRDGMRLSLAKHYHFKHNDLQDLEAKIRKQKDCKIIYVVVEAVYSMDGDSPDLKKLKKLVDKYAVCLVIDEAHSLGVYGEKGVGYTQWQGIEQSCFARLYTFGKALGRHGAVWVGSQDLIDYLTNFARSFIYTTALPSSLMREIYEQYQMMKEDDANREKLKQNIIFYQKKIKENTLEDYFSLNNSPIQFFRGKNKDLLYQVSDSLRKKDFNVKPIFHPTVPKGKERLRISLHSYNSLEEIDELIKIIKQNV
ncbi:MAG: aminotransferase class I/II-fold pyridoxal phosphate-dependent enzyme [Flavobacteriales bacterium]